MGVLVQVANDIRINIEVRGEDQAARDIDKVAKAAAKAGDSVEDLGDRSTDAGKASERAGDKFKQTGDDAGHLAKRIAEATAKTKELITQFDKTGDTSLLKDIGKSKRDANKLGALAKLIAEPVAEAGKEASKSLITNLAEGFKTGSAALKGAAVPVVAGIVIAASPVIASGIAAAVLTGIGAAGIGGGIALAMQDPAVKEAAVGLSEQLKEAFGGTADQFAGPLVAAFGILADEGRQFAANLNLDELAPLVTTLAKGFAGLGQNLLPGLNKALTASKPLIRVLANELPNIGSALSDFFTTISEESDGAAMFLAGSLQAIQGFIRGAGDVIAWLSGIFDWSVRASASLSGFLEDALGWVPFWGDYVADSNDQLEGMINALERGKDASGDFAGGVVRIGESAEETAEKVQALKNGIDELFGITMSLDQATLAYKRGFAQLNEELTEGKRTLDENTVAGQDNIEAILGRITELENLRKAQANSNMGVDAANRLYEKHIEQLRKTLLNLGYNATAVNALIDRYKNIPRTVETNLKLVISTHGDVVAWSMIRNQERQEEEGRRASGGPVRKGKSYWVGENGPELVTFGENGYVHNAADSRAMMSGASGGSVSAMGAQEIRLIIDIRGDDEEQVRRIRKQVEVLGGGNVQVAFGNNS